MPDVIVPPWLRTDFSSSDPIQKALQSAFAFCLTCGLSVYLFTILCIANRYLLEGNYQLLTAKLLLMLVTLGYSAIPSTFDFNNTHATNPS